MSKEQIDVCLNLFCLFLSQKRQKVWISRDFQKMEGYLKLILINFHVLAQSENIKFSNNNMMGNYVGM